jgi:hypothetical protein
VLFEGRHQVKEALGFVGQLFKGRVLPHQLLIQLLVGRSSGLGQTGFDLGQARERFLNVPSVNHVGLRVLS